MSWKQAGLIVAVITLANLAGALWSRDAQLWVWALYIAGAFVIGLVLSRRSERRVKTVVVAPEHTRAALLAQLSAEEQSLVRLQLGAVTPDQLQRVPIDGDIFEYDQTPSGLHALTFWGCIGMSALSLALLALGEVQSDQVLWALAVGVGFGLGAILARYAHRQERQQVIVTPVGIVQRAPNGKRVGILWSELAWVRNRRYLMVVEMHAADGRRRIRVRYTLQRFPQFMELLVSALRMLEERAA